MAAANLPESEHPAPGLPPVTPPSGKFIAQLFLVPGAIVLIAVLLLLLFRSLVGGGFTADQFLKQLDNPTPDIRWRGASDLAQVLKRPESQALKADATFALDLAERLDQALKDMREEEDNLFKQSANLPEKERQRKWVKLRPQRDYVLFLAQALAEFPMAAAAPALADMALREKSPNLKGNALCRRGAAWALGNLGAVLRDFSKLSAEQKERAVAVLIAEQSGSGARAAAASTALFYLDKTRLTEAQIKPTLLLLARDDGHGELIRIQEDE